jgi:hypothetical protein
VALTICASILPHAQYLSVTAQIQIVT